MINREKICKVIEHQSKVIAKMHFPLKIPVVASAKTVYKYL